MAILEIAWRVVIPGSWAGFIIRFCLAAVLFVVCAPIIQQVVTELSVPEVYWTDHSKLHDEAAEVQQCFEQGNIQQVWINSSGERLNCLVQLPDGRTGDAVIQYSCRQAKWLGIVAYVIGDGQIKTAMDILKAKACVAVFP